MSTAEQHQEKGLDRGKRKKQNKAKQNTNEEVSDVFYQKLKSEKNFPGVQVQATRHDGDSNNNQYIQNTIAWHTINNSN